MKRIFTVFLCLLLLSGCGSPPVSVPDSTPEPSSLEPPEPVPPDHTEQDPADDLLSSMTLEEQVGQLFFVRCPESGAAEDIRAYHLGGYLLFGRDFKDRTANEIVQTIAGYQAASSIPLLIGVDEEGGTVVRVSSNPHIRSEKFAAPQRLYALGGLERISADTHEKDLLLSALGINVNFAPVCDVSTNPGDFIYDRSFGQDAQATAEYVSRTAARMAADHMGSVLKHFPGYGNNADTHTGIAVDQRSMETFRTSDFLPFSAGMDAGGGNTAVLVSHNIVQAMDPELPASLSPEVHRILREELGFDGVAMTDDLAMDAVAAYAGDGGAAVLALRAGNDMVVTTDYRTQIPRVLQALEAGELEEAVIHTACRRVLQWKSALGLL